MLRLLLLSLPIACANHEEDGEKTPGTTIDSADPPTNEDCNAAATYSLVIGQGAGSAFFPLEDGASVGLDVAPQGGFGVSVRARTTGLMTDNIEGIDVLLDVEYEGENVGSFTNQGTRLYCQDDGAGLLWGVVVGFDADLYPSNDDLIDFDGKHVTLIVTATDILGGTAEGRVEVVIEVGG